MTTITVEACDFPKCCNLLITDANAFWWEFVLIAEAAEECGLALCLPAQGLLD